MRRLLIGGLLALLPGAVLRAQPLDWPSRACNSRRPSASRTMAWG